MTKLTIAYSDDYLNWKLGSGDGKHPTNARMKAAYVDHDCIARVSTDGRSKSTRFRASLPRQVLVLITYAYGRQKPRPTLSVACV